MQLQHQGNPEMVLLPLLFLHESDPRRDHQQIVLYSFCRSMRLFSHLAVKILLNLLYEDLSTLVLHTSVGCISLQNASRDCTLLRNQIPRNIPNIWHKSSTKHKEVRPDWNDKNDNANYAPSYHMEGFTKLLRLPFLKKYSIKCEKI